MLRYQLLQTTYTPSNVRALEITKYACVWMCVCVRQRVSKYVCTVYMCVYSRYVCCVCGSVYVCIVVCVCAYRLQLLACIHLTYEQSSDRCLSLLRASDLNASCYEYVCVRVYVSVCVRVCECVCICVCMCVCVLLEEAHQI